MERENWNLLNERLEKELFELREQLRVMEQYIKDLEARVGILQPNPEPLSDDEYWDLYPQ